MQPPARWLLELDTDWNTMHDPYPIPCNRFLAAFSDFVERELSGARQAEFMAHLDDCEPCLRHLRAYRTGIAAYQSLESDDVPCDFFEMIQTRLTETGGNLPVAVPVAHPRDADPGRTQRLAGFAVAVAAMFVIVLSYGSPSRVWCRMSGAARRAFGASNRAQLTPKSTVGRSPRSSPRS
jgi:hypothetical protein